LEDVIWSKNLICSLPGKAYSGSDGKSPKSSCMMHSKFLLIEVVLVGAELCVETMQWDPGVRRTTPNDVC
jgi:hypothetical protein